MSVTLNRSLVGLALLAESLLVRQWLAIVLVIAASAGAARFGVPDQPDQGKLPPPPA